jgi:hypothetical protein
MIKPAQRPVAGDHPRLAAPASSACQVGLRSELIPQVYPPFLLNPGIR